MSATQTHNAADNASGVVPDARRPYVVLLVGVAIVFSFLAPRGWPVLLYDGLLAVAVVAAAAGAGAWPTAWLGFGKRAAGKQFCISAAFGLGLLSTATLVLGVTGLLTRPVAWGLLVVGGVAGLIRLYLAQADTDPSERPGRKKRPNARISISGRRVVLTSLALIPLTVSAAIMLFCAVLPPGLLWLEEAKGYDALEYHLQGPREYYEAGRITFLPHNVYTSFPQQMELLYLLLMHLVGGPYAAAISTQLLHAFCGVLAVVALACWTPAGWGRVLTMIVAGSVPWLAYLGCLAYVEMGMLFFAAVAAGLICDHFAPQRVCGWRTALAAGLCAGLAGGCKYTGLVFVAAALGVAWFCTTPTSLKQRTGRLAVFAIGVIIAFSPWLIRNAAFTGNPVYPFAYSVLGGEGWSAGQAAQWDRGHRLPAKDASVAGRARIALRELLGVNLRHEANGPQTLQVTRSLFGVALIPLAIVGLIAARSRLSLMLALWAALEFLAWVALTHMPGRFAVPLVVPLALMAGSVFEAGNRTGVQSASAAASPRRRILAVVVVLLAVGSAGFNAQTLNRLLDEHNVFWTAHSPLKLAEWPGNTELFVESNRQSLPVATPETYIWFVGSARQFYVTVPSHYTVAFSRDPWLEFAATGADSAACVDWLRTRNVTHVVFSWLEIERLRATYGFSDVVTREWVADLAAAGLRRVQPQDDGLATPAIDIYEVVQRSASSQAVRPQNPE